MHVIIHHEFIIIRGLFLSQKKSKFILLIHLTKYTFRKRDYKDREGVSEIKDFRSDFIEKNVNKRNHRYLRNKKAKNKIVSVS